MKIWAVSMVKDEADCIEHTIRHLLSHGVDGIIVANNLSSDKTGEILEALHDEFPKAVFPLADPEVGYYQSRKMTALAEMAREEFGADWIIPFDADEIIVVNALNPHTPYKTIRGAIEAFSYCSGGVEALRVSLSNHYPSYRDLRGQENPFLRISYKHNRPNPLPKVIVRALEGLQIDQGNHGAHINGREVEPARTSLQIRHFPYRSAEHFIRKAINGAAAYKAAAGLPYTTGEHWRNYGEIYERSGEQGLKEWFYRWFFIRENRMHEMTFDPVKLGK
jgi:glycosyltransferase involved in cell wall biosynthesis